MTIEIPAGISEQQAKEWMAILHERKINQEVNSVPAVAEAFEKAKTEKSKRITSASESGPVRADAAVPLKITPELPTERERIASRLGRPRQPL